MRAAVAACLYRRTVGYGRWDCLRFLMTEYRSESYRRRVR